MPLRSLLSFFVCLSLSTIQPIAVLAQADTLPLFLPTGARDAGFQPEYILHDEDIFDLGGMRLPHIQTFLETHGRLGSLRLLDTDGLEKPVAEIIWRVAHTYRMNPKYLLALLQKEQSLIEDPSPTQKQFDWATGYGVCDTCSKTDPSIQEFKGFASQLEWAAKQHREKYLQQILGNGATIAGHAPGKPSLIDGRILTPANQATAMLYSYTPHIAGNLNLWRIWQRWFGLTFPDGTIVQIRDTQDVYLIRFGQKRPFKSRAVAASMVDAEKILSVQPGSLDAYIDGRPILFANYSLIEISGKRYLIDGQKKRLITTRDVFQKLGFNEDEIILAQESDLASYEEGADIMTASLYPTGLLAKDAKNNYWYVDGESRHLIAHKALLRLYFHGQPARRLSTKELNAFPLGDAYPLREGELVRLEKKPDVYVIEYGKKRPISSSYVFEALGWKWNNIVSLPKNLLAEYPLGEPLTLEHL